MSDLERELATLRAGRPVAGEPTTNHRPGGAREKRAEADEAPAPTQRRSRRGLLRMALVSGAAVVGAGALLGKSTGVAHADGNETPTIFTSDNSQFSYAVQANGTNGADGVVASSDSVIGVNASSDSGTGVLGYSISNTGLLGQSDSQYGVHAIGGGASSYAGPGAAGVFAEGGPNYGVYATSDSSTAIAGIADSTLHHWCKLLSEQGEQAFPGSGHQTPQEEEIRQLKRENELLRQERDILKKSPYRISQLMS